MNLVDTFTNCLKNKLEHPEGKKLKFCDSSRMLWHRQPVTLLQLLLDVNLGLKFNIAGVSVYVFAESVWNAEQVKASC